MRRVERPFLQATFGEYDFYRFVGGGSADLAGGDLTIGGEAQLYNGPWVRNEDLLKLNGFGKWTWGDADQGVSLFGSGYSATWDATDQIPRRAVEDGRIGRFEGIDDSLGGETSRYLASASYWRGRENTTRVLAYAGSSRLDLWSNFTYLLDDPENGDQFQQVDKRTLFGVDTSQDLVHTLGSIHLHHTFGAQVRHDAVTEVGLFPSVERERTGIVREDDVRTTSLGLYWHGESRPTNWLRAYVGLRGDLYWADVDAVSQPVNGGDGFRRDLQPEGGPCPRALGGLRGLPELRSRLSQQRRKRNHHSGRPGHGRPR